MGLYNEIIEKILNEEVDSDIKEIMLRQEVRQNVIYKGYELLVDPANTILQWQLLRDNKPVITMKEVKINGTKRINN